jgi:alpha-amylase
MARYHGGDWTGLEQHLDYIEELGVTTLWISPVIKNIETDANVDGYHGYWAVDLTQPNAHFGDLDDLRAWSTPPTTRDMLVVIDIVTNHMGQLFFYDMNLNGVPDIQLSGTGAPPRAPPSRRLRSVRLHPPHRIRPRLQPARRPGLHLARPRRPRADHLPLQPEDRPRHPRPRDLRQPRDLQPQGSHLQLQRPQQLLTGDFPGGLKDVNTTRYDVKVAMVDAYARWIELSDADGFRIDTVKHVEREFWRYFTQRVRQRLDQTGQDQVLHVRRGLRRRRRRWSASSPRTTRPPPPSSNNTPTTRTPAPPSPATSSTPPSTSPSTTRAFAA